MRTAITIFLIFTALFAFAQRQVLTVAAGEACTLKMRSEIATSAVTLKGGLCALSFEKLN